MRSTMAYLTWYLSGRVELRARAKSSDRQLTCADAGVERLPPGAGAGPSRRQLNHQIALTWAGAECRCASIASLVRTNMGRAARFGRRAEVGDHGPGSDEVCSSKGSYSFVSPFCS